MSAKIERRATNRQLVNLDKGIAIKAASEKGRPTRVMSILLLVSLLAIDGQWPLRFKRASALTVSSNILERVLPLSVDGTRTIEKLNPFHNIEPDAYLDPVSSASGGIVSNYKSPFRNY